MQIEIKEYTKQKLLQFLSKILIGSFKLLCPAQYKLHERPPRDHPSITSAKGFGGWIGERVQKMASLVQYCIYADIIDGWVGGVRKSLNFC